MALLVIENTLGCRAYNVKFTITPELKVLNNKVIKDSTFTFIDKKERIQYYVAYTPDMFGENSEGERLKDYTGISHFHTLKIEI